MAGETKERAIPCASSSLVTTKLFEKMNENVKPLKKIRTMEEWNKLILLRTLKTFNGNKTHSAKALGISIRTLRNWLRKYQDKIIAQ